MNSPPSLEGLDFIQMLRLQHQHLEQERAGAPRATTSSIRTKLNELERRILKDAFRQARKTPGAPQTRLPAELTMTSVLKPLLRSRAGTAQTRTCRPACPGCTRGLAQQLPAPPIGSAVHYRYPLRRGRRRQPPACNPSPAIELRAHCRAAPLRRSTDRLPADALSIDFALSGNAEPPADASAASSPLAGLSIDAS
jgi:hypothetical protein